MANNHRYGFRFVRTISGTDTPQTFVFPIATAYAPTTVVGAGTSVNLNIGDPVKLLEDGSIGLVQAGQDTSGANADSDDFAFGIIAGFPRVLVGGYPRPGSFYTTGTTYTGGLGSDTAPLVTVIPVEGNIFEVDTSAAIGAGTKAAALAIVGQTCPMTYSVLTKGNGQPKANPLALASTISAAGADQNQLLVIGLGKIGDAQDYASAFTTLQVMWQARQLALVAGDKYGADTE